MEQRDLIRDQIEQLGRVLGKLLAEFFKLKAEGKNEQGIEFLQTQFDSKLNIEIDELIHLTEGELKKYLSKRNITIGHFESIGESLKEIGEQIMVNDKRKAQIYLNKAIQLIDFEDEASKTMSFERMKLKSNIEVMLNNCKKP